MPVFDTGSDAFRSSSENTKATTTSTSISNIYNQMLNMVMVHGGFAVGSDTTTFATSAATHYILNGQNYTKAATDDIASPDGNTDAGEFRKDLISIDAAGDITVTAGTAAASQGAAVVPATPEDEIPLGWIEVPESFTSGSDNVTTGMLKQWIHSITPTPS